MGCVVPRTTYISERSRKEGKPHFCQAYRVRAAGRFFGLGGPEEVRPSVRLCPYGGAPMRAQPSHPCRFGWRWHLRNPVHDPLYAVAGSEWIAGERCGSLRLRRSCIRLSSMGPRRQTSRNKSCLGFSQHWISLFFDGRKAGRRCAHHYAAYLECVHDVGHVCADQGSRCVIVARHPVSRGIALFAFREW